MFWQWNVLEEVRLHRPDTGGLSQSSVQYLQSLVHPSFDSPRMATNEGICITHLYPQSDMVDLVCVPLLPTCVAIRTSCLLTIHVGTQ